MAVTGSSRYTMPFYCSQISFIFLERVSFLAPIHSIFFFYKLYFFFKWCDRPRNVDELPDPTLNMYGIFIAPAACPALNSSSLLLTKIIIFHQFKEPIYKN